MTTLAQGVEAALGIEPGRLRLRRLTAGASRETYEIITSPADTRPTSVLRRDPPGRGDPVRMRAEAACLRAAAAAGVPVPAVLTQADDAPGIDAPHILMAYVDGETAPRKLLHEPRFEQVRTHLADDLGYTLGLIHRIPIESLDMLDDADRIDGVESMYLDFDEPRPAVEIGLAWLREHRPPPRNPVLVHGDYRIGNLLIDDTGIRSVLDWELAHLGDPIEDLGWMCVRAWRFGSKLPAGGVGSRRQLLDGYERATGVRPGPDELHWWEVFGTLRWLVISRFQAQRHFGGGEHSIELAAIGRRVCESEYDLLTMLGLVDHVEAVHTTPPATSSLHDRPDIAEIIDLVTETLDAEILPAIPADAQRQRYLIRISQSLLRIATRQVADGYDLEPLLAELDCGSEAEVATGLRAGTLDASSPAVRTAVSAAVISRVRVTNPRYLQSSPHHPPRSSNPEGHDS